ncbi:MAG: GNAT family N-acetyltransferase [Chloracidobacterium sp.]|nr:GNAT family N-acetyltransferase [Chloracidobacterium sp.]
MYTIELLNADHATDLFDCGDGKKNEFLRKFALQNNKGGLGRTYVAVRPTDTKTIYGYYTISSSSVKFERPPNINLPRYPLPAILIGKLATDKQAQNQGLGTALLFDALKRAARVAEDIGIFLVEIRAVNEKARDIYIKRGFTPMEDEPMKLFMNLKKVRKLLAE